MVQAPYAAPLARHSPGCMSACTHSSPSLRGCPTARHTGGGGIHKHGQLAGMAHVGKCSTHVCGTHFGGTMMRPVCPTSSLLHPATHLFPLNDGEGDGVVQHGGQHVHKGHPAGERAQGGGGAVSLVS